MSDIPGTRGPLTFQEVVFRAKSLKGCLLPRETCSPGCDLTQLTLDFDSSLPCIWAPLTGNREKQAPPHSSHRSDRSGVMMDTSLH